MFHVDCEYSSVRPTVTAPVEFDVVIDTFDGDSDASLLMTSPLTLMFKYSLRAVKMMFTYYPGGALTARKFSNSYGV